MNLWRIRKINGMTGGAGLLKNFLSGSDRFVFCCERDGRENTTHAQKSRGNSKPYKHLVSP